MRRESYRDKAVVIRTHDFGEADRIIVLLTRGHGLVRGVAKGVRRAKSRFGSRLQLFVELDVSLYPGRNLATIAGADTLNYFASGIIEDYQRYTAACVVLESAGKLAVVEQGEDPWLYDAVVATLARIRQDPHPELVLDSFLLQAMKHAGWAPSLFDCAQCSAPGPHHAFHPAAGGAVCLNCRPSGSAEIPEQTLHLMWLLSGGFWEAAEPYLEQPEILSAAHRLTTAHLQWHLEQKLPSLRILDQG
ncbi:DNA repair protein RecO [Corynebacterium occultum]|uniref:DNA repair protein RecO n=1 Tax=Corynebacterium occultum TaxID=2675219 RepID=A0A6B8VQS2_9CORY|nr:DNA repair protein RecO [Corynebacterium occultum]QGU07922.1 DNA repair protein RecO [Corynebacterium occultum]